MPRRSRRLATPAGSLLKGLALPLAKQGYSERKVNTVVGPWGFNLIVRFEGL